MQWELPREGGVMVSKEAWVLSHGRGKVYNGEGGGKGRDYGSYDKDKYPQVVEVVLDLSAGTDGTLEYVIDGVAQGVAFRGLQGKELRLLASTGCNSKLELISYEQRAAGVRAISVVGAR